MKIVSAFIIITPYLSRVKLMTLLIDDMFIEKENDDFDYPSLATQEDFNLF